jgi:exopolysaccharide biosynthesis polyprenyl glycosylphosphotransferase
MTVEAVTPQRLDLPPLIELEPIAEPLAKPARRHLSDRWLAAPLALPILDFVALAIAFLAAHLVMGRDAEGDVAVAAFPLFGVLALYARGAYAPRLRLTMLDSFGQVAGSISVGAMCALGLGLVLRSGDPGSPLLLRTWLFGLVLLGISRVLYTLEQQRLRQKGVAARRTLIVGAGEVGARIARRLDETPAYGLRPIGFVDANPPSAHAVGGRPAPVLGDPAELPDVVERLGVQHVILAFSEAPDRALLPLIRRCSAMGIGVSLVPRLFDSINDRVTYEPVGGLPMMTLRFTNPVGITFAIKHAIDRVVAALVIVAIAPVLAAIALAVKITSPGPVFFSQRRVGRDGNVFKMLKFRTMSGEPAPDFLPPLGFAPGGVEGVDRRTPIGRWLRRTSLDELPQLFNVLRGEMSLVGPRPERPEYVASFAMDLARYDERHRVRAGITGLSQAHGLRGQSSIADRVELDNYYIEHWSLGMDLKILLMTLQAVLRPAE